MINFKINKDKVINALLHVISAANAREKKPSQYDLVKTLFLADRSHLNRYGRPVTFDQYVAMPHGPVPSFAYDVLKPQFNWLAIGLEMSPWSSVADGKVHRFSVIEGVKPDYRKLSNSDQSALSDALITVLSLGFSQIRALTHEDRAYVAAWQDEEGAQAFPMDMALLIDDPDDGAIDDIRYLAEMSNA